MSYLRLARLVNSSTSFSSLRDLETEKPVQPLTAPSNAIESRNEQNELNEQTSEAPSAPSCTDCGSGPGRLELGGFGLGWWRCDRCLERRLYPRTPMPPARPPVADRSANGSRPSSDRKTTRRLPMSERADRWWDR